MKHCKLPLRLFSVLLAFCLIFTVCSPETVIFANDGEYGDNYENLSPEEKQTVIKQKLAEIDAKLDSLGEKSSETEEYISTLDERIEYLQKELKLSGDEIKNSKTKIGDLKEQYSDNEKEIADLNVEIKELSGKTKKLQKDFDDNYERYCQRLRALYISGDVNIMGVLLTSPDISTLLTRMEMVRRVSKADTALLKSLESEASNLKNTKSTLESKQIKLSDNQKNLITTQQNLTQTVDTLEAQQSDYKKKETAYKTEKEESDTLLANLHKQTDMYSEYRNQDEAELREINAEIEAAAEKYREEIEAKQTTTTTATKPSVTESTTADTSVNDDESDSDDTTHTTKPSTTKKPSNSLNFTYPVPSQKKITCDYGDAGYSGHTGVDYSCPTGSRIVAVESGIVIISTDLYNDKGDYRSYGRYIVIMHDKKNARGEYVYTLYAHNSQRVVSEGTHVEKGQLIAYSGSTGNSTGPHCHFEVRTPSASYDDCVNPRNYLP